MKATVSADLFLKELKKMSILIRKNPVIPITGSVLLSFDAGKLTITGTDLETTYISVIDCNSKDTFSFPVDHSSIMDVCSVSVAPLTISMADKVISILSGQSKHKLTVAGDADHFPKLPVDEFDTSIDVDCEFFYNLSKANLCRAKEIAKPSLDMAAIDLKKNNVTIVGCDGNYLFKKKFDLQSSIERVVMISETFVHSCKSFQDTKLSFGEKCIKAESGSEIVVSVLGVQKYPSYEVVIPTDREYGLRLNTNELKSAMRAISISSNAISKACYINFTKGGIKLSCDNIDHAKESENEINIEHTIYTPKISLNLVQITLLLSLIDSEEVEFSITESNQSILLRPVGDDSILLLIQPLFIN